MTAAVQAGGDLAGPLRVLGESRGRAGAGIAETLDDLGALLDVIDRPGRPLALAKAVAEGWAESGLFTLTDSTCEDPLTGLVTMPYLRTRLGEVYREALREGTCPADTHRLLVVTLTANASPWRRLSRAIILGHDLRAAFPGGETLSRAGRTRVIVLARAALAHDLVSARLSRRFADAHGARVRVVRLPTRYEEALHLLNGLAAP